MMICRFCGNELKFVSSDDYEAVHACVRCGAEFHVLPTTTIWVKDNKIIEIYFENGNLVERELEVYEDDELTFLD